MTTVIIVVVVLVAALGLFFSFARGAGGQKGGAGIQAPPPAKAVATPVPRREEAARSAPRVEPEKAKEVARAPEAPPQSPSPTAAAAEAPRTAVAVVAAPPGAPPAPKKDIAGLRKGLAAARGGFIAKLSAIFQGRKEIDAAILEQMEEVMLASDVGPKTTQAILGRLRESLGRADLRNADAVWAELRAEASRILSIGGGPIRMEAKPTVVLLVGVNGVGKTTTIGKLATRYSASGRKVVLAAGDTFRAAAVQQLEVWRQASRRRSGPRQRRSRPGIRRVRCDGDRKGVRSRSSCWSIPPAASIRRCP